jgi:hypothetical protein
MTKRGPGMIRNRGLFMPRRGYRGVGVRDTYNGKYGDINKPQGNWL